MSRLEGLMTHFASVRQLREHADRRTVASVSGHLRGTGARRACIRPSCIWRAARPSHMAAGTPGSAWCGQGTPSMVTFHVAQSRQGRSATASAGGSPGVGMEDGGAGGEGSSGWRAGRLWRDVPHHAADADRGAGRGLCRWHSASTLEQRPRNREGTSGAHHRRSVDGSDHHRHHALPAARNRRPVTLLGSEGGVSIDAQQIARVAGTISYSVLCGIHARVKRIYDR